MNKPSEHNNLYQIIKTTIDIEFFSKLLFAISLMVIIYVNLVNSRQPILESYAFRQTQTALTAYYLKRDGFKLQFETPVIGEPWSVPFEFPIYQEIVAVASDILDSSLTKTGRLVSLLFSLLTCIPIYFSLARLQLEIKSIYFSLALYLSSPVYMFWAGTFMIESAALFFACSFIYYAIKIAQRDWTNGNFLFFSIFLLLGLLQKITTAFPILLLVLLALGFSLIRAGDFGKNISALSKLAIAILLPILVGHLWVIFSDLVKMENPIGSLLTSSALSGWNFGFAEQRLSKAFWLDAVYDRNIKRASCYVVGTGFVVAAIFMVKEKLAKATIAACFLAFLLPFFIFSNLHFIHSYYQTSNSVFLSISVGVSVCYLCNRYLANEPVIYGLVLLAFISSNVLFFYKGYYPQKIAKISIENNRTLRLSDFIKTHTPKENPVIWYGYDWSSELAFYAERKSLTVPPWKNFEMDSIENTEKFLRDDQPSAVVLCPTDNSDSIRKAINKKYPAVDFLKIDDCEVYLLRKMS